MAWPFESRTTTRTRTRLTLTLKVVSSSRELISCEELLAAGSNAAGAVDTGSGFARSVWARICAAPRNKNRPNHRHEQAFREACSGCAPRVDVDVTCETPGTVGEDRAESKAASISEIGGDGYGVFDSEATYLLENLAPNNELRGGRNKRLGCWWPDHRDVERLKNCHLFMLAGTATSKKPTIISL